MTSKQRTWGQFATPTDVADLLLGFCLRRPEDRLLDPSCGDGALLRRAARWQSWLSSSAAGGPPGTLFGVELDPDAAAVAATIPGTTIRRANFFTLDASQMAPSAEARRSAGFDAVIGNPPYTRAEWIARLDAAEAQLPLFPDEPPGASPRPGLLPSELGAALGGRAGLHAYFFLHSLTFLREGGRLGFIVPNGWLDVAYGTALKQFLLDHFRVLAVVESAVERWFAAAGVNTCVVILERAEDPAARAANRVRFVRLLRPLRDLLAYPADDARRVGAVEQLVGRLLPGADRHSHDVAVRLRGQGELHAADRWGNLLRAPDVHLRPRPALVPLGQWAAVRRGFTTGANDFFYLDRERIARWGIEAAFRRPLLKSLRGAAALRLVPGECDYELLDVPAEARLDGTAVAAYLAWGESQGIDRRQTCAGRRPWYALPAQPPGDLLLAKGVWQRHFTVVAGGPLAVDQQIYRLQPVDGVLPGAAAALLNSVWFALQCELRGRVNLGEGVLWLATYELAGLPLPDPRMLDAGSADQLAAAFDRLAARPLAATAGDLQQPDRRSLDELVFDLVGLSAAEREEARGALGQALAGRRQRAKRVTNDE